MLPLSPVAQVLCTLGAGAATVCGTYRATLPWRVSVQRRRRLEGRWKRNSREGIDGGKRIVYVPKDADHVTGKLFLVTILMTAACTPAVLAFAPLWTRGGLYTMPRDSWRLLISVPEHLVDSDDDDPATTRGRRPARRAAERISVAPLWQCTARPPLAVCAACYDAKRRPSSGDPVSSCRKYWCLHVCTHSVQCDA